HGEVLAPLDLERLVARSEVDRIAAASRGLATDGAVAPHEWAGLVGIDGEPHRAAMTRAFQSHFSSSGWSSPRRSTCPPRQPPGEGSHYSLLGHRGPEIHVGLDGARAGRRRSGAQCCLQGPTEEPMASSDRILIAQGGGPTAVINQSLVGVVLQARLHAGIERIYGARHGVRGIVNEDLCDLAQETVQNLEQVALAPSAALGSTRDKPDEAYCREIFAVLKAHGITRFFYIGGNDSADTVRIVSEQAAKVGYGLRCIHIPKTIDNDLVDNDHTPRYPSAARFVVQAFAGANLDNAALPGVYVAVVMGRNAGFLTAAAALARRYPDDGPHLVYLPERAFDMARFLSEVKEVHQRLGRCVVAVSEGVHDKDGRLIGEGAGG